MTPVIADITEPLPLVPGDLGYPTSVLLSPVFVEGGARRRRLLVRGRYLAAAACMAYLAMLGVTITASPVSKAGSPTRPAPSTARTGATTPLLRAPRAAPPVEVQPPKAVGDADADQDAPLVLRLALPVTPRPAPPKPPATTRPAPTTRPHRANDGQQATHLPASATPVASSAAAHPTTKRSTP